MTMTISPWMRWASLAVAAFVLGGCAHHAQEKAATPRLTACRAAHPPLPDAQITLAGMENRVEGFLACYIGPEPEFIHPMASRMEALRCPPPRVDPLDTNAPNPGGLFVRMQADGAMRKVEAEAEASHEMRLFRAHVIVALLAKVAAYNHTGELRDLLNFKFKRDQKSSERAAWALSAIQQAEYELRSASRLFRKSSFGDGEDGELIARNPPNVVLRNTACAFERMFRFQRVTAVLQAARGGGTEGEKQRLTHAGRTLLAALGGKPTPELKEALKALGQDLSRFGTMEELGTAFLEDARDRLREVAKRGTVHSEDWYAWDPAVDRACLRLAREAGGALVDCTPGRYVKPGRWSPAGSREAVNIPMAWDHGPAWGEEKK